MSPAKAVCCALGVALALGITILSAREPVHDDIAAQEPYVQAASALEKWLQQEVEAKRLPSLSIALVDDQRVVWSRGFGFQDAARKHHATGDTVYRVGSVSKPVTALVIMLLVQMGLIDLDAPVTYCANTKP